MKIKISVNRSMKQGSKMSENKIVNEARQYLYGQNTSNDQIACHTL